jgi:hypothetical protein
MAEKKSFALRIDADTMKLIEKWASDEFRSVNGQIEWMLHNGLKEAGRLKGEERAKKQDARNKSGEATEREK